MAFCRSILPVIFILFFSPNVHGDLIFNGSGWELRRISTLADTFVGVSFTSSASGNLNSGTTISYIADSTNGDHTVNFTTVGNMDGGTVDDTFSYTLRVEAYTGSTFDGMDVTLGSAYDLTSDGLPTTSNQHFGPGWDVDSNQSFRLTMESITYNRGEAGVDESFAFDGFTDINKFGTAGNQYVGLANAEVISTGNGSTGFTGPLTDLVVTSSVNAVRFRDLDFQFTLADSFTAVPEPNSVLFLTGFLGLLKIRRRRR